MFSSILSFLKSAIALAVAFYFLVLLFLYSFQERLLFPAPDAGGFPLHPEAEEIVQEMTDGTVVRHVRFAGTKPAPKLIYFHGNGDTALFSQALGSRLHQEGFDVLLAEYRGYGGSDGKPSSESLLSDALETYEQFSAGDDQPVLVMAHSLGTGVAAYVAHERAVKGLVLVSAYSSLADVAASHYPIFPVRALFRNEIHATDFVKTGDDPVLFMHGEEDQVIPIRFGRALFEATGSAEKRWIQKKGTGHNDILMDETIDIATDFMKSILESRD